MNLLRVAFGWRSAVYLGGLFLFRFLFLQLVSVSTFRGRSPPRTAHAEIIGSVFTSAFVKPVFAILFFKVGVRAWRIWRGIGIIKIRLVNDLIYIIQNHFGMNFIKQVVSVYVEQIRSIFYSRSF